MKLNRKGYMLVEIILASAIAFGVGYFILQMVINLKNKNDDLLVETLSAIDIMFSSSTFFIASMPMFFKLFSLNIYKPPLFKNYSHNLLYTIFITI